MHWQRQGWLKRGDALLDLGAQQLFCTSDPSQINHFVEQFGGEAFYDSDIARLANGGLAGELFARVGSPYTSIDCKPYPFGIVMDLNHDVLPAEHHARYGMVTNHGTSEHIINQWNILKTMHDAAAEGALPQRALQRRLRPRPHQLQSQVLVAAVDGQRLSDHPDEGYGRDGT